MIDPDLMRRLDHWLGAPLCWGATLLRRARRRLWARSENPPPPVPRRVLFILLSESGSMVLADPAVRSLVEESGAEAYFLTFAHTAPALAVTGTVPPERVFALGADGFAALIGDLRRWQTWVKARDIDTLVDLELFACCSALLAAASGIPRRAGFHAEKDEPGRYRGDLYTHRAAYDPTRHMALNYQALADTLLGPRPAPGDRLPAPARRVPGAAETNAVRAQLRAALPDAESRRLVLVNPNASELLPQRRWPAAHFTALVRRLLERHPDLQVCLIGGWSDRETTAAIAAEVADRRCADIAGLLSLPELPALFAEAAVLVSNDSGPAHFAAVSDLPVVVLFGPETPILYRPLGRATVLTAGLPCSPCVNAGNQRRTACRDNRCMQEISVEVVLGAVENLLDPAARPSNVVTLPPRIEISPNRQRKQA